MNYILKRQNYFSLVGFIEDLSLSRFKSVSSSQEDLKDLPFDGLFVSQALIDMKKVEVSLLNSFRIH